MSSQTPYIMPDGKPLSLHLRTERDVSIPKKRKSKHKNRGKDELWQQLMSEKARLAGTSSEIEVFELRALEHVGARRRRRWMNEKLLRDMAGHMTAQEMDSLFKPPPWGSTHYVSPISEVTQGEGRHIWDQFRSIDSEKEQRVLQAWSEYNLRNKVSVSKKTETAAGIALKRWSKVGKNARQALRGANVHSVLQLEYDVINYIASQTAEELVVHMDDSYSRALLHGLANYYSLWSVSRPGPSGTFVHLCYRGTEPLVLPEIICTDVLLALSELGGAGLNHSALADYVTNNIHPV